MGIELNKFTSASGMGDVSLSLQDGSIRVGGGSTMGKIASFFVRKIKAGTRRHAENSAALNSFIRAIANDQNYGAEYAKIAHDKLSARNVGNCEPFTRKDISSVMKDIDIAKAQKQAKVKEAEVSSSLQNGITGNVKDFSKSSIGKEVNPGFCEVFEADAKEG